MILIKYIFFSSLQSSRPVFELWICFDAIIVEVHQRYDRDERSGCCEGALSEHAEALELLPGLVRDAESVVLGAVGSLVALAVCLGKCIIDTCYLVDMVRSDHSLKRAFATGAHGLPLSAPVNLTVQLS